MTAVRRRPVRAQRGVRRGRHRVDARPRHHRRHRQRQRRRDRARSPDRHVGHARRADDHQRAAPARRRRRRRGTVRRRRPRRRRDHPHAVTRGAQPRRSRSLGFFGVIPELRPRGIGEILDAESMCSLGAARSLSAKEIDNMFPTTSARVSSRRNLLEPLKCGVSARSCAPGGFFSVGVTALCLYDGHGQLS